MVGSQDFQERVKNPLLRMAQTVDEGVARALGVRLTNSTTSRGAGSDYAVEDDAWAKTLGSNI